MSDVDLVTLEIIENTLRMTRHEMDAVMFRTSLSPMIRETHDTYPLVADRSGKMLVGQFGSYLAAFLEHFDEPLEAGDVIVQNDPYLCGGSISHVPDVLVLRPVLHQGELVGFTSQFGNLLDVGGRTFGSMSVQVRSIYEEGLRFPPVKLYEQGRLNRALVKVMERNSRAPAEAVADLMALCSATAVGERRVFELCDRFGRETYLAACDALLARTCEAVRVLIDEKLPETPQSFEDFVDDDGQGDGPFKIKLRLWREEDRAVFDFGGTSPQTSGPVNFYLNEGMIKMLIGAYLIMVFDPDVLFNKGFYDLLDVRVEEGSILKPRYPAPLGNRHHTMSRWIDVIAGALGQQVPETAAAAGYGSSPHMIYSGTDSRGDEFGVVEILMGGIPARPAGDGMDAHSWYPQLENTPTCPAHGGKSRNLAIWDGVGGSLGAKCWSSPTGRSRSMTTGTRLGRGASAGVARAVAPERRCSAPTAVRFHSPARRTSSTSARVTESSSRRQVQAAGVIRSSGQPSECFRTSRRDSAHRRQRSSSTGSTSRTP